MTTKQHPSATHQTAEVIGHGGHPASPRVEIVPASSDHIDTIALQVSPADAAELRASSGDNPQDILRKSYDISLLRWTVLIDKVPAAMFGLALPLPDGWLGIPWMIGTPALKRFRRELLRRAPQFVQQMHEVCPALMNFVAESNTGAQRFAEQCGFRLGIVVEDWGAARIPFVQFGSVARV